MPTIRTPEKPEYRRFFRFVGYFLLALCTFVSMGIYGGVAMTDNSLPDVIESVSPTVAYGAPVGAFVIWLILALTSRFVPPTTTELRRRDDRIIWEDGENLEIRGEPAVVLSREVLTHGSQDRSDIRVGAAVHWLPEGAEQYGADTESDELAEWIAGKGHELVDFGDSRRRTRQFARTLATLAGADLYLTKRSIVRYRPHSDVDATLAEHLEDRPLESAPSPAEAGLETDQIDGETTVYWTPPLEDKLLPTFLVSGVFASVTCIVSFVMWGWTPRAFWTVGIIGGGLVALSLAAWIWYGLRTLTVEFSPAGITTTDEIAGVWSRSKTIPSEDIWMIEWVPGVRGSRAVLRVDAADSDHLLGLPVPGSRARDIRQIARSVIAHETET
jgi:hypothetical protein